MPERTTEPMAMCQGERQPGHEAHDRGQARLRGGARSGFTAGPASGRSAHATATDTEGSWAARA